MSSFRLKACHTEQTCPGGGGGGGGGGGSVRGHLQTKIFTLNVIVTLKGGGGVFGK